MTLIYKRDHALPLYRSPHVSLLVQKGVNLYTNDMLLIVPCVRPRTRLRYGVPPTARTQQTYVREDMKLQQQAKVLTLVIPRRTITILNSPNGRASKMKLNYYSRLQQERVRKEDELSIQF